MKKSNTKKLALAGVLCAVAVVGSMFSFPVFGSKCAPVQHMVNVLCAVLLGPWYGVGAAFVASLLRNLLGLGSLMAFPGSMCGALLCGIVYHKTHKLLPTLIGEVFGTGIIGGLLAWPVAILFMGKDGRSLSCLWARPPVILRSMPTLCRSWFPPWAVPSLPVSSCLHWKRTAP